MSESSKWLGRLLAIRRLSEDLNRRSLQLALASVAEVEAALGRQESALADSRSVAQTALASGDRCEWLMADAQAEVAGWNRGRLREILCERSGAVPPAMERFLISRREQQQASQMVEDARSVERIEEDRKAQLAADDWFLSRRNRSEY